MLAETPPAQELGELLEPKHSLPPPRTNGACSAHPATKRQLIVRAARLEQRQNYPVRLAMPRKDPKHFHVDREIPMRLDTPDQGEWAPRSLERVQAAGMLYGGCVGALGPSPSRVKVGAQLGLVGGRCICAGGAQGGGSPGSPRARPPPGCPPSQCQAKSFPTAPPYRQPLQPSDGALRQGAAPRLTIKWDEGATRKRQHESISNSSRTGIAQPGWRSAQGRRRRGGPLPARHNIEAV